MVADRVAREYWKLRGVAKRAGSCYWQSPGAGGNEVWLCDLEAAGDDGYCYSTVAWGTAGRVKVAISHCEREMSAALVHAYVKRTGRDADRARCTEDEQNEGTGSAKWQPRSTAIAASSASARTPGHV